MQNKGSIHIYEVNLFGDEAWCPIVIGERAVRLEGVRNGNTLFTDAAIHQPPEIKIYHLHRKEEKQLTFINKEIVDGWLKPNVEHLNYPGFENEVIEGWILTPIDGKPPNPMILCIHGGAYDAFGNSFSFDLQMLAGSGYAVLLINPRGSTGYGCDFATL